MSLRKEKAARLKLAILEEAHALIGKKPFEDLYVDDICERVKISKVTFFKYFPQKEDLLLYHFRIWCLRCAVELKQNPKPGVVGMYYLIERLAEAMELHPGIMLSLVGYLSDLKRTPKPFPVKIEERVWLFPDVKNLESFEIHSLEIMIESFVLEAIFKKEITRNTNTRDITHLLTSVIYGSMMTAHLLQQSPVKLYFRKNLDLVLKGLQ
jgi:AcrR family transcriptional regulator